eukprot:9188958-Prorocentrum_lima.AAC.1
MKEDVPDKGKEMRSGGPWTTESNNTPPSNTKAATTCHYNPTPSTINGSTDAMEISGKMGDETQHGGTKEEPIKPPILRGSC